MSCHCPHDVTPMVLDSESEGKHVDDEILRKVHALYERAHSAFKDAVDIFSGEGVTRDELFLTMSYISLVTHHDIKEKYVAGHIIVFYCAGPSKKRKRRVKTSYFSRYFSNLA